MLLARSICANSSERRRHWRGAEVHRSRRTKGSYPTHPDVVLEGPGVRVGRGDAGDGVARYVKAGAAEVVDGELWKAKGEEEVRYGEEEEGEGEG